jgi:hypothetical protein
MTYIYRTRLGAHLAPTPVPLAPTTQHLAPKNAWPGNGIEANKFVQRACQAWATKSFPKAISHH